jgi:hypothetical protein
MTRIRDTAKRGGVDVFIDTLPGACEAHLGLCELEERTQKHSGSGKALPCAP